MESTNENNNILVHNSLYQACVHTHTLVIVIEVATGRYNNTPNCEPLHGQHESGLKEMEGGIVCVVYGGVCQSDQFALSLDQGI